MDHCGDRFYQCILAQEGVGDSPLGPRDYQLGELLLRQWWHIRLGLHLMEPATIGDRRALSKHSANTQQILSIQ